MHIFESIVSTNIFLLILLLIIVLALSNSFWIFFCYKKGLLSFDNYKNKHRLTRLPSKIVLLKKLHKLLGVPGNVKTNYALLLIDIDNFEKINRKFGNAVGDIMLRKVAPDFATKL